MNHNFVNYHIHSYYSLLDSCTAPEMYIQRAAECGMKAFGFSEHGNIFNWYKKKQLCDKYGLKYLHGIECYITESLDEKVKDNWHTILIAKNQQGFVEINRLFFLSYQKDHFYYKPRITVDEFLAISDNVIKISACIQSPLWQFRKSILTDEVKNFDRMKKYIQMCKHYDYYEIQYHSFPDNLEYTKFLWELSKRYNKSLIVGTDTHSLDKYKAECRTILQYGKTDNAWGDPENECDLTFKTYDELVEKFREQNVLPMDIVLQAIENTNVMADSCDVLTFDTHNKYPYLYGEKDEEVMWDTIKRNYKQKRDAEIISSDMSYVNQIKEEMAIFKKVDMVGFMLFMSEMMTWAKEQHIATGVARGSVAGSVVAYITNITDVDPIKWHTIFSRFCNEHRVDIADVDTDWYEDDRQKIYDYIINRFGSEKTGYVLALGTMADKSAIAVICKALRNINKDSPYTLEKMEYIKAEYDDDPKGTKAKYPDVFYYFDGLKDCVVSQSQHPAGIIASPINLIDFCGAFLGSDGQQILPLDMDMCHDIGLVKYDILGLKTVGVIDKTCKMIGKYFPSVHEIDFNDQAVYEDIAQNPATVFQFESSFAADCFKKMHCTSVDDISLVNACIRPSGASYRDRLLAKELNDNGSEIVDKLLSNTYQYLVYQEQINLFLSQICGFSGSDSDEVRRAIAKKKEDKIAEALPKILEGYCNKSDKPREIAEQEATKFLQVIKDSSSYMFGYNHSLAYSIMSYLCGYYRHYYPVEYCTAYLSCAKNDDDLFNGQQLARDLNIKFENVKFRHADWDYSCDSSKRVIYKGLREVPRMSLSACDALRSLYFTEFDSFNDLLKAMAEVKVNVSQMENLIKLNYFEEFGDINYLLEYLKLYKKFQNRKKRYELIAENMVNVPKGLTSVYDMIQYSYDVCGMVTVVYSSIADNYYFVSDIKGTKYTLYQISTGKNVQLRIRAKLTKQVPINVTDIISVYAEDIKPEGKWHQNTEGKWVQSTDTFEDVVQKYQVLKKS